MRFVRPRGFTLIELMIVVAILSVVAVLAVVSYGRYIRKSARSEVVSMLGEIRIKEEAYLAEIGSYLSTTTNETTFWPDPNTFTTKTWSTSSIDARWGYLGVNPPRSQLYCGYTAQGGAAGTNAVSGTTGQTLLGTASPTTPWFYARSACDFDSNGSFSYFNITYSSNVIQGL